MLESPEGTFDVNLVIKPKSLWEFQALGLLHFPRKRLKELKKSLPPDFKRTCLIKARVFPGFNAGHFLKQLSSLSRLLLHITAKFHWPFIGKCRVRRTVLWPLLGKIEQHIVLGRAVSGFAYFLFPSNISLYVPEGCVLHLFIMKRRNCMAYLNFLPINAQGHVLQSLPPLKEE